MSRLSVCLLGLLWLPLACKQGGGGGGGGDGTGDGTGERRGVQHQKQAGPVPGKPTPAAGAPRRGSVVVAMGDRDIRIGNIELKGCPEDGCRLGALVKLPKARHWCAKEPSEPVKRIRREDLSELRVRPRNRGGVKLALTGVEEAWLRSPARIYPCPAKG
ncbi:MAG: hypothetical protein HRU17_12880 [Polyangiaceae bacterium]|nr:hypothetical protein [Polyangiaceae bacterium]